MDKISQEPAAQHMTTTGAIGLPLLDGVGQSLMAWIELYQALHVRGAPLKTQQAKTRDLTTFVQFFRAEVGHDHIDTWTPAVTKHFQQALLKTISQRTGRPYDPNTVNRVMATVRHFGRWVDQQRPLVAGDPLEGVRDVQVDDPDWNGLTPRQILRLKAACEQRIKACVRGDQNPLLEAAVFYTLLQSGLRESELVALDIRQYHHRGLYDVQRRKNKRVTAKVPLAQEARDFLDRYLVTRLGAQVGEPLFISRYGNRLHEQDVRRICLRLLKQAQAFLSDDEKFRFTPHMLRHTFLKKVTDKHGVHFAQQMSGNISIKEIFRYAKPSQDEVDQTVEELFQ
ncbi:MAG: tyrosine-type recombinase/integrase [Gammaproteobacteria bacterium]|nr:tyrosine-type recombinase/integrase [Gammaproteobacteria bacterium]